MKLDRAPNLMGVTLEGRKQLEEVTGFEYLGVRIQNNGTILRKSRSAWPWEPQPLVDWKACGETRTSQLGWRFWRRSCSPWPPTNANPGCSREELRSGSSPLRTNACERYWESLTSNTPLTRKCARSARSGRMQCLKWQSEESWSFLVTQCGTTVYKNGIGRQDGWTAGGEDDLEDGKTTSRACWTRQCEKRVGWLKTDTEGISDRLSYTHTHTHTESYCRMYK